VRLAQPLEVFPFERTYIRATAEESGAAPSRAFDAAAAHARASDAWHYREVATSHVVPSNRPAELTDILLGCA
jgi:hypothetical protein